MSLRDAWESEARNWIAWARAPGHDSYWKFHRDAFPSSLPPPALDRRGPTADHPPVTRPRSSMAMPGRSINRRA